MNHATISLIGIIVLAPYLRRPGQPGRDNRRVFYAFGAGEGMLLDKINPAWRRDYFVNMPPLDGLFKPSR